MNLMLMKEGSLRIKDETLSFQEIDSPLKTYPIEMISNIYAFSDISVSCDVLKELKKRGINLFLYNRITKEYMELLNNNNYRGNTLVNQVRCYLDEDVRLYIAKQIVDAEINNLSYSLLAYRSLGVDLKYFKDKRKKVQAAVTANFIMLNEALAIKRYYEYIDCLLAQYGFRLLYRRAYRPTDPVNKMITFLNGVLYNEISSYIVECGLNPSVGYNRSSNDRKYTLQLDMADIYKPITIEKVVVNLIHDRTLKPENFKHGEDFSQEVRTKLIEGFYKRIKSSIRYNNKHMTYQDIIKQDIYKLRNYVNGKGKGVVFYKTRF